MSGPQEMNVSFQHLGTDYNIQLIKGKKSDHSVEINGVKYAVLGDKEKLDTACMILNSVSLESISNEEDLRGRLSLREDISFPQAEKTDQVGVEILKTKAPNSKKIETLEDAYEALNTDLQEYANKNLKEGALLVQVVGIKGSEKPLVFGKRSVNDKVTVPVDENTIGRTGSGAKLWAGLLTNILTSKYSQYIQMNDGFGKFAPNEALRKFGTVGTDGKDVVNPELAKEIPVEGLIGMMAGLEYEQPNPKDPPQTTLDQFLRGNEVKDGSIHILYHPRDKINFYTNNICFAAYPLEKAYKKVLAAELIEKGQLDENQSLRQLSPHLEPFRKQLQEKIEKTEEDIKSMQQLGALDDVIAPYEDRLANLKVELKKLSIPENALDISLKDLMDCQSAYTDSPNSFYIYDLIELFLMPSDNHQVDYAEIMKREFLGPLGMDHSGFHDVPGIHMDVTFENDKTKQDESYVPGRDHPMRYGAGFGRTSLTDASKLASALSDPRGLTGNNGNTVLLSKEELDDFFKPHGHYEGWGLGGAELTSGGKVIDKGGSLNQDQYSFWVDRETGVGMIAMCNCGRRPDEILNTFKERIEHISHPQEKAPVKEKEGAPLGISTEYYFEHPLVLGNVEQLYEGTRGRIALLFDYDSVDKGVIHWSGTPLEVEKREDGAFHVTTPGRFKDLMVKKIVGEQSGKNYLAVGDTSFIEIDIDNLPSQENVEAAQKEFANFRGQYINQAHLEWGVLEFEVLKDKQGNILLGARDGSKGDFVPQSVVKFETNSILFNGHDRQPPDKIFRFVRESEVAPWRLQVLDYASKQFIEERPKS